MHELIRKDPRYSTYGEVLDWALNTETVYDNSHQKNLRGDKKTSEAKIEKASSNILSRVAYKYSKQAMEEFFRDERLY